MTRGLNKVMLIGRVGRDPEMRYTPTARPVTTFTISATRSWNTSDGNRRTETDWFNIVAWGNLAEICKQFLVKDRLIYIEGRLQTRFWEDQEGSKHSTTEVVANEMILLDERRDANQADSADETNGDEFPF
jgi:single-strand DNA-binding protein